MTRGLRMSQDEWQNREAARAANEQRPKADAAKNAGMTPALASRADEASRPPAFKLKPVTVPESVIKVDALEFLQMHPKVAWAERFNTGAGKFIYPDGSTSQFIRFGFPGLSDILGMLVGGRQLACECKQIGEDPKPHQQAFLDLVNRNGGLGFVARRLDDVVRALDSA